jgi:GT2 family glycosyltransferase
MSAARDPAREPKLSVVIPSWNTRELLAACLDALGAADLPETETIVVENASADGSAEMVAERFPDVVLVRNAENRGFAGGCNQGMALSRGRFVLLLNSDTEVARDAIARLIAWLEAHPAYGAAAPLLHHPDGRVQPSLKRFPGLATALWFSTPLQRWFPDNAELRRYFMRDADQAASADVDQPPAACLLIRRDVLELVGPFDEALWLFYNDVDLSKRMAAAGFKTRYVAEARVLHHEGASTSKYGRFVVEWQRNRLTYYRKHHGWFGGIWLKACVSLAFADWLVAQLWRKARGKPADGLGETAGGYLRFLLS